MNYLDAHYPYLLVPGRSHRFGVEPTEPYQRLLIQRWWELDKTTLSPQGVAFAANAYDDCVADLDEQLGKLIDELDQRGVLKQTWLIVTSDHGESFGEHAGIFCHGKSLYETEVRVPLIVIPPGGREPKQTVKEAVSLRDMAATIVDLAGLQRDAPFPGESLARFWNQSARMPEDELPSTSPSLAEVAPNDPFHRDFWAFPNDVLHWEPSRRTSGRTFAERGTFTKNCFTCAKMAKRCATWPPSRPPTRSCNKCEQRWTA